MIRDYVEGLLESRKKYVLEAIDTVASRDEEMAKEMPNSWFEERASFLRNVEDRIENGEVNIDQDYPNIANSILEYELLKSD